MKNVKITPMNYETHVKTMPMKPNSNVNNEEGKRVSTETMRILSNKMLDFLPNKSIDRILESELCGGTREAWA